MIVRIAALLVIAGSILFGAKAQAAEAQTMQFVTSAAALTTLDGSKIPFVHLTGYYAGSPKGGGDFIWQPSAGGSPDSCTVFSAGAGPGHWLRQLPNSLLDVTMCGAKWDGAADDGAAITAAFGVASRDGYTLTCPGGTGRIATTVAPANFRNVVLRCQGMNASTIACDVPAGRACFLFQNINGLEEVQAPQLYDLSFTVRAGPRPPGAVIQYNSMPGGFTDSAATQSYMMRPVVQRVRIIGGTIGILCAKCFDGDFSLNEMMNQQRHGIDLEGSDWMSIGDAGTNRIKGSGGYPIVLASHGTFGNGNLVSHNDILAPAVGVDAYIYSSARTAYIEKNFLEGATSGACEIKIDKGAIHATVRDNHVTDRTVKNWLCVVPLLRQAEFSDNQTTSHGQGAALFLNRGSWKDFLLQRAPIHFGNWSEAGFPGWWWLAGFP